MQRLLFLLFAFAVKVCIAQTPIPELKKFPSYETVVQHFKSNYSTSFDSKFQVRFARKPFGWYVELYDITQSSSLPVQSFLLWSYNRKQFQQIALKARSKEDNPYWLPSEYEYEQEAFRIHPFFGYIDWSKDVCEIIAQQPELNDTLLYAIGRAYSDWASHALWHYGSYSKPARYDTTFNKNDISPDSVLLFMQREKLSILYFQKTFAKNPTFLTKVGNIYTKYSNEHIYAYHTLTTMGFSSEAASFIIDGLYDDFILCTARNMLNSCPTNALLITGGDNDTYPLLYIQAKDKYRDDVIVANSSLLNTGRFVYYLRTRYQLQLQLSNHHYANLQYQIVRLDKAEEVMMSEDALNAIGSSHIVAFTEPLTLPSSNIFFAFDDRDSNGMHKLEQVIAAYNQDYLSGSDIFLIDFIQHEMLNHPICFANTCPAYVYKPFNERLTSSALVLQLSLKIDKQQNLIIAQRLENLLLNQYCYQFVHRDNETFQLFISNYKIQFRYAINMAISINDTLMAQRIANKYLELFSKYVQPYSDDEAALLSLLIQIKMYDKANAVCEELLNEANKFIKTELSATWERIPDESGVALWIYICNLIKEMDDPNIQIIWKKKASIYYDTLLPFYH